MLQARIQTDGKQFPMQHMHMHDVTEQKFFEKVMKEIK